MISLLGAHIFAVIVILAFSLTAEGILRFLKASAKADFEREKIKVANTKELESLSLRYNKRRQLLDSIRILSIFVAIFVALLAYDIQAFSYFVLVLGAFIVIMKESVASMFGYVYVLMNYEIGDDVRINDSLGEIVAIQLFATSMMGKEDSGEYNGKLIKVPNYLFLSLKTEIQELKTLAFRRTATVAAITSDTKTPFPVLVKNLREYLDERMPVRSVEEIGHFKSYAGRRYRLSLDYNLEGDPTVRVAFVAHPDEMSALRQDIIMFIENARMVDKNKLK